MSIENLKTPFGLKENEPPSLTAIDARTKRIEGLLEELIQKQAAPGAFEQERTNEGPGLGAIKMFETMTRSFFVELDKDREDISLLRERIDAIDQLHALAKEAGIDSLLKLDCLRTSDKIKLLLEEGTDLKGMRRPLIKATGETLSETVENAVALYGRLVEAHKSYRDIFGSDTTKHKWGSDLHRALTDSPCLWAAVPGFDLKLKKDQFKPEFKLAVERVFRNFYSDLAAQPDFLNISVKRAGEMVRITKTVPEDETVGRGMIVAIHAPLLRQTSGMIIQPASVTAII